MAHRALPYQRRMTTGLAVALLLFGLASGFVIDAGATEVRHFANGINAVIHTPEDLLGELMPVVKGEDFAIQTPQGVVTLTGRTADLVPFNLESVERALANLHDLNTTVDVDVYILPATPLAAAGSFARQDAIYLAPGTGSVAEATVAYVTTHEMGHVLTWAFLDNQPARWEAYRQLRGLDPVGNGPDDRHADRAREILAEDIRFLFGGRQAVQAGGLENHDLVLPSQVAGLQELLTGFFAGRDAAAGWTSSSAFPNPCNPLTTIAFAVPRTQHVRVTIHDLQGRLVRTLVDGTRQEGRHELRWAGETDAGDRAASGGYIYRLQTEERVLGRTMVLTK